MRTGASRVADAAAACGDEFVLRRATRTLAMTDLICGRFADAHQVGYQAMEPAPAAPGTLAPSAYLASRAQSLALKAAT